MSFPNLDQPVVVFSLAFGPLGVIIVLVWIRSFRRKKHADRDERMERLLDKEKDE